MNAFLVRCEDHLRCLACGACACPHIVQALADGVRADTVPTPWLEYRAIGWAAVTTTPGTPEITIPATDGPRVTLPADAPGRGWGVVAMHLTDPVTTRGVVWAQRAGLS